MNLNEFKKRFTKEYQGYKNNITGGIVYCPCSLGLKVTREDCIESNSCEECWNEVEDYLKFKESEAE